MRILACGDLHTKIDLLPTLDKVAAVYDVEQIVILGDSLDEWNISGIDNLWSIKALAHWARERGDVKLLLGNHDVSYLGKGYGRHTAFCGMTTASAPEIGALLEENQDLFSVAVSAGNWLFSHAGVTDGWAAAVFSQDVLPFDIDSISADLNAAQQMAAVLNAMSKTIAGQHWLAMVGRARGGASALPGPLWADRRELMADPLKGGVNQIVGHSPVRAVQATLTEAGTIAVFCDTLSLMPSGEAIGTGEFVLLDSDQGELWTVGSPPYNGTGETVLVHEITPASNGFILRQLAIAGRD